jgi:hypothetical protein
MEFSPGLIVKCEFIYSILELHGTVPILAVAGLNFP